MIKIEVNWNGEVVEVKPSFDLFMRIEEKVSINRVSEALSHAGAGNIVDLPMSHVAWVVCCCLRHAGVKIRDPMEVHSQVVAGSMPDCGTLLVQLINAFYGAGPEKIQKKSEQPTDQPQPSESTSGKDTASQ